LRSLSLFSGAGGGLLGERLLGWEHVGYVEFNEYCQKVIAQRIEDGLLDDAPIFSDIRAFIDQGYATSYKGMVDVVTAGFPCQPFSVAGKRAGEDDSRNLWPETLAVLRAVRPRYALLENVPGLLAHPYARRIFGDLAESGFDADWRVLSAAECGAPHKRDRVWIYCHTNGRRRTQQSQSRDREPGIHGESGTIRCGCGYEFAAACGRYGCPNCLGEMADSGSEGLERRAVAGSAGGDARNERERSGVGYGSKAIDWWATEPRLGRVADGVANRVDRLKATGNGQVPAVVRAAWQLLTEGD